MHNGTYIVSKLQQKCTMEHTLSVNYNRNAENKLKNTHVSGHKCFFPAI